MCDPASPPSLDVHRCTHLRHKPATSLYHRRQSHNDVGMKMSIIILCAAAAAATHTNTTHTYTRSRHRRHRLRTQSDIIIYEIFPLPLVLAATVAWLLFLKRISPYKPSGIRSSIGDPFFCFSPHVCGCYDCAISNRLLRKRYPKNIARSFFFKQWCKTVKLKINNKKILPSVLC